MLLYKWLQECVDEKQCVHGRRLKICLQCIHAQDGLTTKDVVLLLSTRFQVDCCWICSCRKNNYRCVEGVLVGWIWEYVVEKVNP